VQTDREGAFPGALCQPAEDSRSGRGRYGHGYGYGRDFASYADYRDGGYVDTSAPTITDNPTEPYALTYCSGPTADDITRLWYPGFPLVA